LGSAVIPVAFAAALPLVQWCTLCIEAGAGERQDATAAAAALDRALVACAGGREDCAEHGAREGQCPFERPAGRTFCVGPAMGGPGVRPHASAAPAPSLETAFLVPEQPAPEPESEPWLPDRLAEARPPTRSWAQRPPVRGPPVD